MEVASRALAAFGDGSIFIENTLSAPISNSRSWG